MKTIEERVEHYANKLESFKEELRGVNALIDEATKARQPHEIIFDYNAQKRFVIAKILLTEGFLGELKEIAAAQCEAPKQYNLTKKELKEHNGSALFKDLKAARAVADLFNSAFHANNYLKQRDNINKTINDLNNHSTELLRPITKSDASMLLRAARAEYPWDCDAILFKYTRVNEDKTNEKT